MLADLIDSWTTNPTQRKWLLSYLPVLLSVLLICFMAWQLANLFWAVTAPPPKAPESSVSNPGQKPLSTEKPDLGQIKQANLFGSFQTEAIEPVIEVETIDAPETALNLNLHGTLLSNTKEQSRAIIEVSGKDKVFSIGDEIQNNVSLDSVQTHQVILNNRGRKEALKLPREEDKAGSNNARPVRANTRRPKAADRIARELRSNLAKNPSSITDILRLKKGQTNTGQKGFRIYPGKERQRFSELGLKPGDFVTQINGSPVADQNPFQIVQTLGSTSYINLSIERNGQPMNLSFDLSQTR